MEYVPRAMNEDGVMLSVEVATPPAERVMVVGLTLIERPAGPFVIRVTEPEKSSTEAI